MLDRSRTRVQAQYEMDALSSAQITANGAVVQMAMDNGVAKARASNATADTIPLGFSIGLALNTSVTLTKVEQKKAVASVVTLDEVAVGGTADVSVFAGNGYGGTALTPTADAATAPANTGQYQLGADGKTITLYSDRATADVFVVYRYAPTVAQFRSRYGDVPAGVASTSLFNRVGIITSGQVYTDQFVTSIAWGAMDTFATGEILRGGANGRVTVGGNGCDLSRLNVRVLKAPSVDDPWLGLSIGLMV